MILTDDQCQEHLLTTFEQELLLRMLTREFRGREALLVQLQHAKAKWVDSDGSPAVLITVENGAPKAFVERTPLDAELIGHDADGMPIRFVLHVLKGSAVEIEIFREDGEPIDQLPSVMELENAYPPR